MNAHACTSLSRASMRARQSSTSASEVISPAAIFAAASTAGAQSFFRIVSGSAGGNYFPMAGILANAISNPPGSRPCGPRCRKRCRTVIGPSRTS